MDDGSPRQKDPAAKLTPERVAHLPAPGGNVPVQVQFSPDARLITFLFSEEGTLNRELWAFDPESGHRFLLVEAPGEGDSDSNVPREEALRRERQRVRGSGITTYSWSRQGDTLLVPLQGSLCVRQGDRGPLRLVTGGGPPCIDAKLNHDGTAVAFVRGGELYSSDLTRADGTPERLTFDASPPGAGEQLITNGLAEFVAQEEMDRSSGFWWSVDGRFLAFERVDNTPVDPYTIVQQGEERVDVEIHRYPFAGERNAAVRLGYVRAKGGAVNWLPLPAVYGAPDDPAADGYLARVDWAPDGCVLIQVIDRTQRRLELRRVDPATRTSKTILVETAADWLNLHDDLRCVPLAGEGAEQYQILWSSERTGARQLYAYDCDGILLGQLTPGPWPVDRVVDIDESKRLVYFLGAESPLEMHLYRAGLDGGGVARITQAPGMHDARFDRSHGRFVDSFSSVTTPPALTLRSASGLELCSVFTNVDQEIEQLDLRPPELVAVAARDGATLYGAVYRPPATASQERFPVLVSVYGGPHVQMVVNGWGMTADLRAQYLAQRGFIVFKLDNRGSSRRGHLFEAPILRRVGGIEVDDQVDGVRWLATQHLVDPSWTGIYGWSYGGYMALMCVLKAPDVFKAGVAGAPVTSWDGYDTFYTERYMETPRTNTTGYRESAATTHVAALNGRLMLVHGMLDENVHFRHTARLVNALNAAQKPYGLVIFPSERHGVRSEAQRATLERRLADFFVDAQAQAMHEPA